MIQATLEYNDLSDEEKIAYNGYKNDLTINNKLRAKDLTDPHIDILDRMILKSKYDGDDIKLYRVTLECNILPYIDGGIYKNPEFLSTTDDKCGLWRFWESEQGVFLIINCSSGFNYLDMELNPDNGDAGESELLLGRNLTFEVKEDNLLTNKEEVNAFINSLNFSFSVDNTNSIRVIEATLINSIK